MAKGKSLDIILGGPGLLKDDESEENMEMDMEDEMGEDGEEDIAAVKNEVIDSIADILEVDVDKATALVDSLQKLMSLS